MIAYHVSTDLTLMEKEFIPRIPKDRLEGENATSNRICVAKDVQGAVSGLPHRDQIITDWKNSGDPLYLACYPFDLDKINHIKSENLLDEVPDVKETNECWLLEKATATPMLIKIEAACTQFRYERDNLYYGPIVSMWHEEGILAEAKTEIIGFIGKKFYQQALRWLEEQSVPYTILRDLRGSLCYRKFKADGDWPATTTKTYREIMIQATFPSGMDISPWWLIDAKQHDWLKKNNLMGVLI